MLAHPSISCAGAEASCRFLPEPPRCRRRCRGSAFTLIELLVVMAIMALLIAVLLPALESARGAAHVAASLSNLRQLAISHHLYAGDHDDQLIRRAGTRTTTSGTLVANWPYWTWTLFSQDYLTDVRVFWSPARDTSAIDPARMQAGDTTSEVRPGWEQPGYGVNEWMMPFEGSGLDPIRLGDDHFPQTEVIMMAEAWQRNVSNRRAGIHVITATRNTSTIIGAPFTYRGAALRSYLDGHARSSPSLDIGWRSYNAYDGAWIYTNNAQIEGRLPWFRR